MAWQRTSLGLAGVSALLLHQTGGRLVAALPGVLGLALATTFLVVGELRYERITARIGAGADPVDPRLPLLMGGAGTLLAAMAVGLILLQG